MLLKDEEKINIIFTLTPTPRSHRSMLFLKLCEAVTELAEGTLRKGYILPRDRTTDDHPPESLRRSPD